MTDSAPAAEWISIWLDRVAGGETTMSQRRMTRIEARGGLDALVAAAKARGIHLLRIEDDAGNDLVAASLKPFTVLC